MSFGPNQLSTLIDSVRIALAFLLVLIVILGVVAGLVIASVESRRDNKIKARREPTLTTLEDGIALLVAEITTIRKEEH